MVYHKHQVHNILVIYVKEVQFSKKAKKVKAASSVQLYPIVLDRKPHRGVSITYFIFEEGQWSEIPRYIPVACMVITCSKSIWISRVRLPILLVVS